jgi:RNA polymerase sigma-70 factor (ECF subfamily)
VTKIGEESDLTELVKRIIAGDPQAEDCLIRRYKDGISIIISRTIQRRHAIEDLCQETFRIAIEKIRGGDVREPERLSGFISAVARNLAKDYVRKARRLINQEVIEMAEKIADHAPDPLEQLCEKERAELIRQVINELRIERDREVILRYYIAGEDKDQICADLGLTREQFSRVIFRALERFKKIYLKLSGGP